jgi:hypothetical protein
LDGVTADLTALEASDPLAARPSLWRRAFAVAAGFGVPLNRVLALKGRWQSQPAFTTEQVDAVIDAACQRASIPPSQFWLAVRAAAAQSRDEIAAARAQREHRRIVAIALAVLPDENDLAKIARYEAHLSRQFYRALHELARLQAARQSQPHPANASATQHALETRI